MKKSILTILNIFLFLFIFIGFPYFNGRWGLICISWIPAGFVFQIIEDVIDDTNRNNKQKQK